MKYKKAAAILAAATVFFNTMSMTYAETSFTDIENSWAKAHIISVYDKGLMNGTTESIFSPETAVIKYSAIISIARMMGTGNMDLSDLVVKHKEVLDKYGVPEYARKETAFCLEKGIVQGEIEMDKFAAQPQATKLDICVYLGRAFGVQLDTSKPPVTLSYKDALSIPSMYKIYVDHMIKVGVVDGKGDAEGLFKPSMPVSRAMFAKMLDAASNEYVKTTISTDVPDLPAYVEDTGTQEQTGEDSAAATPADNGTAVKAKDKGIIDTITYKRNSQPKILLENEDKKLVEYTIPEDLMKENIIINGQLSDVHSLRPGLYVELDALSGIIDRISTIDMTKPMNTTATIKEVNLFDAVIFVDIYDQEGIASEKKVYLQDAKIADLMLNMIDMGALSPGQVINLIGIEDVDGIKAQTIILNQLAQ